MGGTPAGEGVGVDVKLNILSFLGAGQVCGIQSSSQLF